MTPTSPSRRSFYHVAGVAHCRAAICDTPSAYRILLGRLRESAGLRDVPVLCYCVLPRQWHLVMGPTDPKTVGKWLDGAGLTHRERIVDLGVAAHEELIRVCRHVERLAFDVGLVRRAQDWPWSSLADRMRGDPLLPMVAAPFLATRAWVDYVNRPVPEDAALLDRPEHPRRLA